MCYNTVMYTITDKLLDFIHKYIHRYYGRRLRMARNGDERMLIYARLFEAERLEADEYSDSLLGDDYLEAMELKEVLP